MSVVTNISDAPQDVPLLGRVVQPGETVTVPDVQADGVSPIVWPAETWQPA
jgi:hypothetical protein